jgi:hypothetical protein
MPVDLQGKLQGCLPRMRGKNCEQQVRSCYTGYSNRNNCRSLSRWRRCRGRWQTKNREEENTNRSENTGCRIYLKVPVQTNL